ncbi:MAG: glycosyltransferase family A protein [Bacteroidota bacterium]|nr:glycosyltransferase family A protein [Bacteroidota bacterium]
MNTGNEKNLYEIISHKENIGETPLVTVIITLYNYQSFIAACLDSLKNQTINKLNLVIVDDCSKDRSLKKANIWLDKNGNRFNEYVLARHTLNRGLAVSRNTAISLARTKYIFILDADNSLYHRCLESLVSALENCDASFAYSYLEEFGDGNKLKNTKPWNPTTLGVVNTIDAMVLLRKSVLEKVNGYSIMPVMGWEDYELWFKIARIKGWGVQVPEILARYRVHKTSMLNTVTNPNVEKLWEYLEINHPEFFK